MNIPRALLFLVHFLPCQAAAETFIMVCMSMERGRLFCLLIIDYLGR